MSKKRKLSTHQSSAEHQEQVVLWEQRNKWGGMKIYGGHSLGEIYPPEKGIDVVCYRDAPKTNARVLQREASPAQQMVVEPFVLSFDCQELRQSHTGFLLILLFKYCATQPSDRTSACFQRCCRASRRQREIFSLGLCTLQHRTYYLSWQL